MRVFSFGATVLLHLRYFSSLSSSEATLARSTKKGDFYVMFVAQMMCRTYQMVDLYSGQHGYIVLVATVHVVACWSLLPLA